MRPLKNKFLLLYSGATDHAKHCKITGNTLLEDSNNTAESLPSITFNLLDIKQRQPDLNKETVEMMQHVWALNTRDFPLNKSEPADLHQN